MGLTHSTQTQLSVPTPSENIPATENIPVTEDIERSTKISYCGNTPSWCSKFPYFFWNSTVETTVPTHVNTLPVSTEPTLVTVPGTITPETVPPTAVAPEVVLRENVIETVAPQTVAGETIGNKKNHNVEALTPSFTSMLFSR
jgi:hypothetical protein